jgi:alginate O-acetyltransferase complex protein AlgI
MNFVQVEFLWFMATVLVAYWTLGRLPRGRTLQNGFILCASIVFYGWAHAWFLIPLFVSALIDFYAGQAIEKWPRHKAYVVLMSLCGNLGMLAYFKYFNFFVENVVGIFDLIGVPTSLRTLEIALPIGISFYTFQSIAYTIDIYRGELKARKNLLEYLVYVTFFPQLVAGPIQRANNLLVQVERDRVFSTSRILSGLSLAMWGGFKKMCIADTIAPYIDKVFVLESPAGPMVWAAAIGFSIQIFADFSGYTDIARGTSRMIGFELTENFRSPYLAATTPEFWQRWHISLSTWIRDYLMVPLLGSGSRLTTFRFVWATILTFVIIGFWHGASWNFILFGLWHGVWMTVYTLGNRGIQRWFPDSLGQAPSSLWRPPAIVFHFFCVSVPGSLLFRETHIDRLGRYLQLNPFAATEDEWIATSVVLGFTLLGAAPLVLSHYVEKGLLPRLQGTPWLLPIQTASWAAFATMMFVFYRVSTYDFIYFQF